MITSNKELRKLLRQAEDSGWNFRVGGKHIKGKHQSGRVVTISISPTDSRALKNIKKDLSL